MQKDTATDLELVGTQELINELGKRHEEIIILREDLFDPDLLKIYTKTRPGKSGNPPEDGYDLGKAVDLLQTATALLVSDYIWDKTHDEDDSDAPQDAQEGGLTPESDDLAEDADN